MRIEQLGDLKDRDKSRLQSLVGLFRASDLFGECDGVYLRIEQHPTRSRTTCFISLILSPDEARNLGNRLIEGYNKCVAQMRVERSGALPQCPDNPHFRSDELGQ